MEQEMLPCGIAVGLISAASLLSENIFLVYMMAAEGSVCFCYLTFSCRLLPHLVFV